MDKDSLLAAECVSRAVTLKKSPIRYPNAGFDLFATKTSGPGETVGLYYVLLVYINLVDEKRKGKARGKIIIAFIVRTRIKK